MGNVPSHDTSPPSAAETNEGIPAPSGEANLIDTDYVIGQDNIKGQFVFALDIHGKVFTISALVAVIFVILALALQNQIEPLFSGVRDWLTHHMAWFFIGAANVFVLLCLGLILSPLGKVRIGGKDARLHLHGLVLHAVRRRYGHRPDVLRRVRAHVALQRGDGWYHCR